MNLALLQAQEAQKMGEVPVGAVIVDAQGKVIASGQNRVISDSDPSAHAEIVALRQAARALGNYRLPQTTLYVTLEPRAMCLGAMFHARVRRIVFAAYDPKTGACGSRINLTEPGVINFHAQNIEGGVLQQACGDILSEFFRRRRQTAQVKTNSVQSDAPQTISTGSHGQSAGTFATDQ